MGDCVYILKEVALSLITLLLLKDMLLLDEVVKTTYATKKGLYAPLTKSGRIVVNGILTSCYSDYREHILMASYFKVRTYIILFKANFQTVYGFQQFFSRFSNWNLSDEASSL